MDFSPTGPMGHLSQQELLVVLLKEMDHAPQQELQDLA
jgi:hypothetical protein